MIPGDPKFYARRSSDFLLSGRESYSALSDRSFGGVALTDTSEGLLGYTWLADSDGSKITLQRSDQATATTVVNDTAITHVSATFDQNMRPCIAYIANGVSKLYWYDSADATQKTTDFPGIRSPRVALDDKRSFALGESDIILAYIRNNGLYYREQRDRFTTEKPILADLSRIPKMTNPILKRIGMGTGNRFQFQLVNPDCLQ